MISVKSRILVFATLVAIVTLFLYGRNSLYVIQNEKLKSENIKLKSRISTTHRVGNETRTSRLKLENEQLKTANEQLKTENERFKTENEQFKTANERFKTENEQLKTSNEQFKTANEQFKTENERFKTENEQFKTENDQQFKTANEQFETDHDQSNTEIQRLQAMISQLKNTRYLKKKIPESRNLDRSLVINAKFAVKFQQEVTILIYSHAASSQCIISQIDKIREGLRTIRIIVIDASGSLDVHDKNVEVMSGINTEGQALNVMIQKVRTRLFLYLGDGAAISKFDSENSVAWLYHALEAIPELDIVGGSYIRYNASTVYPVLDVQCYRHKMCYWVFEQRYEYQYSVGDMMICEETSSSFMARSASIAKLTGFDATLTSMAMTDFFYRVRHKAVVGLRPEVFFDVTQTCTGKQRSNEEETKLRIPFIVKHDLIRVMDSFGNRYTLPTANPHKSPFVYHKQGGFNTVTMIETLKSLLVLSDDFFQSKNITYLVEAGVALGGLKMRDVLPWDTGDIDTIFYGKWDRVHKEFRSYCADRKVECLFRFVPYSQGKEILLEYEYKMGANTMFYKDQVPPHLLLMHIHGRLIPVRRGIFEDFRKWYNNNYLQNRDHQERKLLECSVPSHHACVPRAFSQGGGHWKDFYCDT